MNAPLFTPFEWVPPAKRLGPYNLLSDTRDMAAGIALVLQIVEKSALMEEAGGAPVIESTDANMLTRMSIAAMNLIADKIDSHFDTLNDRVVEGKEAAK